MREGERWWKLREEEAGGWRWILGHNDVALRRVRGSAMAGTLTAHSNNHGFVEPTDLSTLVHASISLYQIYIPEFFLLQQQCETFRKLDITAMRCDLNPFLDTKDHVNPAMSL